MEPVCPKCGETEAVRPHADYVTRIVDFYVCEVCGHDWQPVLEENNG